MNIYKVTVTKLDLVSKDDIVIHIITAQSEHIARWAVEKAYKGEGIQTSVIMLGSAREDY